MGTSAGSSLVPLPGAHWLPALSAVLLALSSPGGPLPLLCFVALVPWAAYLAGRRGPWRLAVYLAGCLHFLLFSWSLRHVHFSAPFLVAAAGGLYPLLAAALFRRLLPVLGATWALGLAWAAMEWLRAALPGLPYPHAQIGHSLYQSPWLLAGAAWWGEAGMNLVVAAASGLVVDLWNRWRHRRPGGAFLLPSGAGVGVLLAAAPLAGAHRSGMEEPRDQTAEVAFLAVQPGFSPERRHREGGDQELLETLLRLTREALAAPGPRPHLVVWPESVLPDPFLEEPATGRIVVPPSATAAARSVAVFAGSAGGGQAVLLAGGILLSDHGGPRLQERVAAFLLDGAGRLQGTSEKRHLVPGGETLPFLDRLPAGIQTGIQDRVERHTGGIRLEVSVGRSRGPMSLPAGPKVGLAICFENAFPSHFARLARQGASFFVVVSNESWYRGGQELDQMEAMAVLRALETGRPVLRCTTDGITVLVEPDGRRPSRLLARGRDRLVEGTLPGALIPRRQGRVAVLLASWIGPFLWAALAALVLSGWLPAGLRARLLQSVVFRDPRSVQARGAVQGPAGPGTP